MKLEVKAEQPVVRAPLEAKISITITNSSTTSLRVPNLEARELITLIVWNEVGDLVIPTRMIAHLGSMGMTLAGHLKPGETYVLHNQSDKPDAKWISLSAWGYPNLPSGTYEVSARPGVLFGGHSDIRLAADSSLEDFTSADSNWITLEVR